MATAQALRIVEREARVYRRLWRGSAFTSFITPLLYLASIGIGLGGIVDAHNRSVAGLTYLGFVTPGLLAASAVQAASGDSLWPVMAGFKWMGHYHAAVAAPPRPADVYTGTIIWTGIRTSMSAAAFLAVAAALGGVSSPWAVLAVPAAVAGALAFAAPLAAFAVTQETDIAFPVVMRLAVIPLFLFSGTFFPVSQLPGWGQGLVVLSPLWHAVELCRSATTGSAGWVSLGHVAALLFCIGAGTFAGRRTFHRKLAP